MDANARPTLVLCHANGKGTGSAMKMELYPARVGDPDSGAIYATIALQTGGAGRGKHPSFDWDNGIVAKLEFCDLAKMLQVFYGETESIDDGKGLYRHTESNTQVIRLRHTIEPINGYVLDFYQHTPKNGISDDRSASMTLHTFEALGLKIAIENSMALIAFGGNENWEDVK